MQMKMTAKRQVTFPRQLCEEMRLQPGDAIQIEQTEIDGRAVWVLSPPPPPLKLTWVGSLHRYAKGVDFDMTTVRKKIMEEMKKNGRIH